MLRNLINQALRARAGTTGTRGGYGRGYGGTSRGASDPGSMVGSQIGRRVFAALRRRG